MELGSVPQVQAIVSQRYQQLLDSMGPPPSAPPRKYTKRVRTTAATAQSAAATPDDPSATAAAAAPAGPQGGDNMDVDEPAATAATAVDAAALPQPPTVPGAVPLELLKLVPDEVPDEAEGDVTGSFGGILSPSYLHSMMEQMTLQQMGQVDAAGMCIVDSAITDTEQSMILRLMRPAGILSLSCLQPMTEQVTLQQVGLAETAGWHRVGIGLSKATTFSYVGTLTVADLNYQGHV